MNFSKAPAVSAGLVILAAHLCGAAEPAQSFIVRNALGRPVRLEISNDRFATVLKNSNVRPHWEAVLNDVKLNGSGEASGLEARVLEQAAGPKAQEITRCDAAKAETSSSPRMAVIIYKDTDSTHCSIVDLNAFKPITTALKS